MGQVSAFEYNLRGELIKVNYNNQSSVTFDRDELGNITKAGYPNGSEEYTYWHRTMPMA